ncbi:hypothetical protein GJ744_010456 [Endocarpon pusillum]|uniref:Uncharacterized protein n=1 Tax=Endocarpon pusillum TaxID=364733 RepID=A0A8H7AI23_9EURO|nr:hypothetical protein GJ744_010456 [Endocarpon pusillum]
MPHTKRPPRAPPCPLFRERATPSYRPHSAITSAQLLDSGGAVHADADPVAKLALERVQYPTLPYYTHTPRPKMKAFVMMQSVLAGGRGRGGSGPLCRGNGGFRGGMEMGRLEQAPQGRKDTRDG